MPFPHSLPQNALISSYYKKQGTFLIFTGQFSHMVSYPITVFPFPLSVQTAIKWNIYGFSTFCISLPILSALDLNLDNTLSYL